MTNKILALKYRPQEFEDLIGQEIMAQTIVNAIKRAVVVLPTPLIPVNKYAFGVFPSLIALVMVCAMTSWPIKSLNSCGLYLSARILFVILKEAGNNLKNFHYGCFFSDLTGFMKHPPDANLNMSISRSI